MKLRQVKEKKPDDDAPIKAMKTKVLLSTSFQIRYSLFTLFIWRCWKRCYCNQEWIQTACTECFTVLQTMQDDLTGAAFHPLDDNLLITHGKGHLTFWTRRKDGFFERTDIIKPVRSISTLTFTLNPSFSLHCFPEHFKVEWCMSIVWLTSDWYFIILSLVLVSVVTFANKTRDLGNTRLTS